MNYSHVEIYARQKIKDHNLVGWAFQWDSAKRRLGACKYSKKQITVSRPLFDALKVKHDALDTILHEIAHAIAGSAAGHGPKWQKVAREIGAKPERCYDSTAIDHTKVDYKYTAVCPKCNYSVHYNRQWKRSKSCGKCTPGRYDSSVKLQTIINY
jgi:SprT protein